MNKVFPIILVAFVAFSLSITTAFAQTPLENIQKISKAKEKLNALKEKLKEKLAKINNKIKVKVKKGLPNKANKGNPVFTGKSSSSNKGGKK